MTLVKETGAVVSGANSYAGASDGDSYFEGHVAATVWTGATTAKKEAALVMATRLIDAYVSFNGRKVSDSQALQWPRYGAPNPDASLPPGLSEVVATGTGCFASDSVPTDLVKATCEEAMALLVADRTGNPIGEGIRSSQFGESKTVFDRRDRAHVLSRVTRALLAKLGVIRSDRVGGVEPQLC